MSHRLVLANWKMNGSLAGNAALLSALAVAGIPENVALGVCVPFPYLAQAQAALAGTRVALGAQTVSEYASGAYTGEVSVSMLKDFGCSYAIVGHSERRALYGERDAAILAKLEAVLAGGMVPVLCCGETLEQHRAGQAREVVREQLAAVASKLTATELAHLVVAYEPVWAIGSGLSAGPDVVCGMHAWIREVLGSKTLPVLYGGSVKPDNAAELFASDGVSGALVGGASLIAEDFVSICRAASAA